MSAALVGSRVPRDRTIFIAPKCTARRRILIAGMGTSPAVLTETAWALAHGEWSVMSDDVESLNLLERGVPYGRRN